MLPYLWNIAKSNFEDDSPRDRRMNAASSPAASREGSEMDPERPVMTEIRDPPRATDPAEARAAANTGKPEMRPQQSDQKSTQRFSKDARSGGDSNVSRLQSKLDKQSRDMEDMQVQYSRLYETKEKIRNDTIKLIRENRNLGASFQQLQEKLVRENKEREELQQQVIELKQGMSTMGREYGQLSTESLREETRLLAHDIQNWVRTNTRKLQLDAEKITDKTKEALSNSFPFSVRSAAMSKFHVFQAIIVQKILAIFNTDTLAFDPSEEAASKLGKKLNASISDKSRFNQWRSMTYTLLYNVKDDDLQSLTRNTLQLEAQDVEEVFNELLNAPPSTDRVNALQRMLFRAIKLSRSLRTQRADLRFEMPDSDKFTSNSMQDEHGQDATDMEGEKIAYFIFPMLVKYGNDNGDNEDVQTVISKARVVCAKEVENDKR